VQELALKGLAAMSGDSKKQYHFVIMAAQRTGVVNPLAAAAGVSHKALVEINGKSLIERTLSNVVNSGLARRISVSIEDDAPLRQVGYVSAMMDAGVVRFARSADNLFEESEKYLYMQHPRHESFEALVDLFTGMSFNGITREMMDRPEIRENFEAAATEDGYVFDQPMLVNLYRRARK